MLSARLQRHPTVACGRSSGLRPALRAPLRGLAGGFLMSPSKCWLTPPTTPPSTGKPVAVAPLEWSVFVSPLPAHFVCWSASFAPKKLFGSTRLKPRHRCQKLFGSPTRLPPGPELAPPISRLRTDHFATLRDRRRGPRNRLPQPDQPPVALAIRVGLVGCDWQKSTQIRRVRVVLI